MTNRSQKSRQRTAICHFSFVIGHWSFGKSFSAVSAVVRKNRSAGVSPASEPRQLLLGQHDLCRLEAGDTFFLTTTEGTEAYRGFVHLRVLRVSVVNEVLEFVLSSAFRNTSGDRSEKAQA